MNCFFYFGLVYNTNIYNYLNIMNTDTYKLWTHKVLNYGVGIEKHHALNSQICNFNM